MAERSRGRVKWFNSAKGYGFVAIDGQNQDIFVHFSAIVSDGYKKLDEGDVVEFDIVKGKKGLQAENVVLIQAAERKQERRREDRPTTPRRNHDHELDELEEN